MATGVLSWSQTAGSNANSDSAVDWHEGQAPSSVNDSARAMMASTAKWRDDIHGILVTSGTGTAYAISSNQVIASNLNGATFQFTPGATNTGPVTLSVDGQTARPIRFRTGIDLPAGALISGSLYQVSYRAATTEWLLHSFDSSIYTIPIGASIDWWAAASPNSAFAFMYGQAISRTTYAALFSILGTTYGLGDGSSTFNLPDLRGRVVAGADNMGGSAAGRLNATGGMNGTGFSSTGGAQTATLSTSNLPAYTPTGSITNGTITVSLTGNTFLPTGTGSAISNSSPGGAFGTAGGLSASQATSTFTGDAQGGSSTPFSNVQPTITANKLMRII